MDNPGEIVSPLGRVVLLDTELRDQPPPSDAEVANDEAQLGSMRTAIAKSTEELTKLTTAVGGHV